jgi:hypothetical protein
MHNAAINLSKKCAPLIIVDTKAQQTTTNTKKTTAAVNKWMSSTTGATFSPNKNPALL